MSIDLSVSYCSYSARDTWLLTFTRGYFSRCAIRSQNEANDFPAQHVASHFVYIEDTEIAIEPSQPIRWVIQDRIFGDETTEMIQYVSSYVLQGNKVEIPKSLKADVYRGSIEFVEIFGSPLLSLDNYRCSKYYASVPYLMNCDCVWMPWWKLESSRDELQERFPGVGVFVRPDVGRKVFTGTTLTFRWWKEELKIIHGLPTSNIRGDDIVLVAKKRTDIRAEYRLLMHKNEVLGSVLYCGEDEPTDALELAIANRYFPDTLYTLDVALTDGGAYILELNSFVSSGLYDMDFKSVVPKIEAILLAHRAESAGPA
jgi:hypothetical protein